jgi:2-polyprenyl-3-methyl-5-hydroxy-6-metoxy-1,4-benzoquinol methylase
MLVRFVNSTLPGKDRQNVKVLDLGFGTGRHLVYLAEEGFDTYGIEYSRRGLEIAKEWLREKGLRAKIKSGSAVEDFFDQERFDAVVDIASIQHNEFKDMKYIISKVHDALKPGGYLFSVQKNRRDTLYKIGQPLRGITREFPEGVDKVGNSTIISFPTLKHISKLYSKFSTIQVEMEE